ncbi:ABC transporter ATP-binding protein [Bacillus sp. DTU_2020_1000418_1_SI_GHA_SEK_038]|uniref:ABC transporter ATP-binding protein n=1 Tax=Bacillus sp. DTU_2020_1000418_1_SI_GHA_SEK_038 TaxID=3077585 RepID=UPI0028E1A7B8|nr:ABC transporter ATP-binding protein [Bacillus sp. DTU_2020_1000418_1_SI_GHA_SEK_038]WNS74736.1 ABC transporter ATP-binding protein [Bacillus sp. DTU_2020_1000418_1_SI_GHA_SEK_038]
MGDLLTIKNLKTSFPSKKKATFAVDGVDFHIKAGESVALVGESGCGKSMTSFSIMRLLPPPGEISDGEIIFEGKNLVQLSEAEMCGIRGKDISMIFQEPMTSLNPVLTIGEQIIEVIQYHQKLNRQQAKIKAGEMLELVGFSRVEEILKEYPHRLSGGMRQRVVIAIAMSCNPKLLIADEPTTALDVTIQAQILDLMRSIREKFNTSILLITHDLGVVSELTDRVIVMYAGQVVEEAKVRDIFRKPLHPYTEGLINSVPSIRGEINRLFSIPGSVSSSQKMQSGCKFAPRCPKAFSRCFVEKPTLTQVEDSHTARCFLYE